MTSTRAIVLASALLGAGVCAPLSAQLPHPDSLYDALVPVVDSVRSMLPEGPVTLLTEYGEGGVSADVLERIALDEGLGIEKDTCDAREGGETPGATLVWLESPLLSEGRVMVEVVVIGTGDGSALGFSNSSWRVYLGREDGRWGVTEAEMHGIGHGLRRCGSGGPR